MPRACDPEPVSFITCEDDGRDLIVSFAVQHWDEDVKSLTLMRTPKSETLEDPDERGVGVSFERLDDGSLERDLLQEVRYSEGDEIVELKTQRRHYRLDVHRVDPEELADMRKLRRKMNFDRRLRLIGI